MVCLYGSERGPCLAFKGVMQLQGGRSQSNTDIHETQSHPEIVADDAWAPADVSACFMSIFVAPHMLTFSPTIASDKSVEAGLQLHCGAHTKQSLTSALLHFISVVCFCSVLVLPCSYC